MKFYNVSKDKKITLWIIPNKTTNKFIRNIQDLDINFINILKNIHNLFENTDITNFYENLIYINKLIGLPFLNLHIHFFNQNSYVRTYPAPEMGVSFIKEENIKHIINNIICNSSYYNEFNIPFIYLFPYI
jgi:hypothetical protein